MTDIAPAGSPGSAYRVDIEGMRGIAVLLVILYHARLGFTGGYVGVDVFFVLSGFLITGILSNELHRSGTIDLTRFYARRLRRLLPAAICALLVTDLVAFFIYSPFEHAKLMLSSASAAMYLSNIFFAQQAVEYLGDGGASNPFLHMWSLSVEEQFYLMWPIGLSLVALGPRRYAGAGLRVRLQGLVRVVLLLSFTACVVLTMAVQPWAFFLPFTRAWEFAAGAAVAIYGSVSRVPGRAGSAALGWVGLALVVGAGALLGDETSFPGYAATVPVVGTCLLIVAGHYGRAGGGAEALLESRVLQYVGQRSYSLYLWHWPALVFARELRSAGDGQHTWVALLTTLILAEASYRWIENPIRFHPKLVASSKASFVLGALLTLSAVGGVVFWRWARNASLSSSGLTRYSDISVYQSPLHSSGCHADYLVEEATGCTFGDQRAPVKTAVLFGDSHAEQWAAALIEIAERQHWRLITLTKTACPAANLHDQFSLRFKRTYAECDRWRVDALARIDSLHPDLVLTSSSFGYENVRPETWREATASTFASLSSTSGVVVHLTDPSPPGFDVLACLSRRSWYPQLISRKECSYIPSLQREELADAVRAAAATFPNVHVLKTESLICLSAPCPAEFDIGVQRLPIWYDNNHLSTQFVKSLSGPLFQMISDIGRVQR